MSGCGNLCNKERAICGHPCQRYCHPNIECPTTACNFISRVECICGNKQAFFECGATDNVIYKQVMCDDQCKNL